MMVRSALERGAIDKLLISEGLRKNTITLQCGSCKHEWTATIGRMEALPACPSCEASGDNAKELNSVSLIDELGKMAERSNTEIVYISIDTEEGSQLLHGFGGLAALCRYPMM
jgi:peptide chain release factor subunit 1